MTFEIYLTDEARAQFMALKNNPALEKRFKAVAKTMQFLAANPKHPSLNTHEYTILSREFGRKIFEAYAENKTPGAYRIFWYYGDAQGTIIILYITPHP